MGVIYLVRHGQASFGTNDYDRLSQLGHTQAQLLGVALGRMGVRPKLIVTGSMRRQHQTAAIVVAAAGWRQDVGVDSDWDEFDHQTLASAHPADGSPTDPRVFQESLEAGMRGWAGGNDGSESFVSFCARTQSALHRILRLGGAGDTVVVTSAGVISSLVRDLLGGDTEQWIRLNRVCVNTGVTKIVHGSRGLSLVSFNSHDHLGSKGITYR